MNKKDFFRRIRKSKFFCSGAITLLVIILMCFLIPAFLKYDPLEMNLAERLLPPDWFSTAEDSHFFGTDALGRDVLTRLLVGGRTSIIIALSVALITTIIGLFVGLFAGYYGGVVDLILMRLCDILMAVPGLLLAVCFVAVLGPSIPNLIIVMAITSWLILARVVRGTALSVRSLEYVKAARVLGIPNIKIIFFEVLPNVFSSVVIAATQGIGATILTEASLSYLGLGVPPPAPSWGSMIADGRTYIETDPWTVIVPGVILMITVLAVNFIGDGLNDIMNPKNRD
jgi:ABC-type dipeptide/oligopeptide/nickel transport system permease subunit